MTVSPYLQTDEKISTLARALRRVRRLDQVTAPAVALAMEWRLDEAARLLPQALIVERARRTLYPRKQKEIAQ